jgi:hypothetical protein
MTPVSPCSNKPPPTETDMGRNRSYTVAPTYIYKILLQQNVLILFTSEVYVLIFLTHQ